MTAVPARMKIRRSHIAPAWAPNARVAAPLPRSGLRGHRQRRLRRQERGCGGCRRRGQTRGVSVRVSIDRPRLPTAARRPASAMARSSTGTLVLDGEFEAQPPAAGRRIGLGDDVLDLGLVGGDDAADSFRIDGLQLVADRRRARRSWRRRPWRRLRGSGEARQRSGLRAVGSPVQPVGVGVFALGLQRRLRPPEARRCCRGFPPWSESRPAAPRLRPSRRSAPPTGSAAVRNSIRDPDRRRNSSRAASGRSRADCWSPNELICRSRGLCSGRHSSSPRPLKIASPSESCTAGRKSSTSLRSFGPKKNMLVIGARPACSRSTRG